MSASINHKRREFLGKLGWTAGALGAWTVQDRFKLMGSALAAPLAGGDLRSGYKSLVCVYLAGGADSWNMMAPTDLAGHNRYAAVRQSLAIPRTSLLPVSNPVGLGFHPAMPSLRRLYNEGRLAVAANIGNLLEPLSRDQVIAEMEGGNAGAAIPPGLFSHSHQTETWLTALPSLPGVGREGWGGRMASVINAAAGSSFGTPSFTLSESNFWQASNDVQAYGLRPQFDSNGYLVVDDFRHFDGASWPAWARARADAWARIRALAYGHPLEAHAAGVFTNTKASTDRLRNTLGGVARITTPYDENNPLAARLRGAAQLIAAREMLGMSRQLIFVSLGGWDTHSDHLETQGRLFAALDHALDSFYRTTVELGVADSVTTFTGSEFGRTFTSNGDGTDHAWAADAFVMGGAVNGGRVHGEPIQYSGVPTGQHWGEKLYGPADVGSGRFIPKYSVDQYGATLAQWMGFSDADVSLIFPNLRNFTQKNLGFML